MTCPKCHRGISPLDLFCGFCGGRVASPPPAAVAAPVEPRLPPVAEPRVAPIEVRSGGLARRAAAGLVDGALLGVWLSLAWVLVLGLSTATLARWDDPVGLLAAVDRTEELAPTVGALFAGVALAYAVAFLVLEGATPGKMLFGLLVRRAGGGELGVARALARETVGRLASVATLGIGFLLAAVGDGRALHDRIVRTEVVRTS